MPSILRFLGVPRILSVFFTLPLTQECSIFSFAPITALSKTVKLLPTLPHTLPLLFFLILLQVSFPSAKTYSSTLQDSVGCSLYVPHGRARSSYLPGTFWLSSSTTNETFLDIICNISTWSHIAIQSSDLLDREHPPHFLLPDCFYLRGGDDPAGLSSFLLSLVIIQGNSTYPDPLVRFAASFPNATNIAITNSILLYENGTKSDVVWDELFLGLPKLTYWSLASVAIGSNTRLPNILPGNLWRFRASFSGLTGTLPPNLLRLIGSSFSELDLTGNRLVGTIPPSLISNWTASSELMLRLGGNQFQGEVPRTFFLGPYPLLRFFILDVSSNLLTGKLDDLTTFFNSTQLVTFEGFFGNNLLTGSIPSLPTTEFYSFTISAPNNRLSGTIPASGMHIGKSFTYDFSGNRLIGTVPPRFFYTSSQSLSKLEVDIDVSRNRLSGSISAEVFSSFNLTTMAAYSFNLSSNGFIGCLPAHLINYQSTQHLSSFRVDFSNCPSISGHLPSTLLSSISPPVPNYDSVIYAEFHIDISNTSVSGRLHFPPLNARPCLSLSFSAAHTLLNNIEFHQNSSRYLSWLNISNSPITGTLPPFLFTNPSSLKTLKAASTLIAGTLPDISALHLSTLVLSESPIDFCSPENRSEWIPQSTLQQCELNHTNAFSCNSSYPTQCTLSAPNPTCSTTLPPPGFICIDNSWISNASVSNSTFTVPAASTHAIISGNLTSSSVILGSYTSSVTVLDCAENLTLVTIQVSDDDLKQFGSKEKLLQLISYSPSCRPLNTTQLSVNVIGKSCRSLQVTKVSSEGSLRGLFKLDSSRCNTWWIVLVSVLGGVIVLGVVLLVLLATFVPSFRETIRPFSKPSQKPKSAHA